MEIEILEMAERKCRFILKDSTPAMANALRRTMMADIPKMAIDTVEFHLGSIEMDGKDYESTTPLFDEIIAHRLGMVPIPTDYGLFNFKDQCTCNGEGCPNCEIMYSLNKHGPCTVLSGDLQPLGSQDLKVKDEEIPIVELADGQSVLIYAHAVMGTAKQHAKWQVAISPAYGYLPVVKVVKPETNAAEDIVKLCPKHVFEVENGKLVAKRPLDCILCKSCMEDADSEAVEVSSDDSNFIFGFETDGSLTAQQVLDKAVEILAQHAREFAETVSAF